MFMSNWVMNIYLNWKDLIGPDGNSCLSLKYRHLECPGSILDSANQKMQLWVSEPEGNWFAFLLCLTAELSHPRIHNVNEIEGGGPYRTHGNYSDQNKTQSCQDQHKFASPSFSEGISIPVLTDRRIAIIVAESPALFIILLQNHFPPS